LNGGEKYSYDMINLPDNESNMLNLWNNTFKDALKYNFVEIDFEPSFRLLYYQERVLFYTCLQKHELIEDANFYIKTIDEKLH
jgi:hypothetical protein